MLNAAIEVNKIAKITNVKGIVSLEQNDTIKPLTVTEEFEVLIELVKQERQNETSN